MFAYELSIALHPLIGCVPRHSTANCQHHALFQVQLCMLAFPGKLFFFSPTPHPLYKAFQENMVHQMWCRTWFLFVQPALPCCLLWESYFSSLHFHFFLAWLCIWILNLVRDHGCDIKSKYSLIQQSLLFISPWAVHGIWGGETNTYIGRTPFL